MDNLRWWQRDFIGGRGGTFTETLMGAVFFVAARSFLKAVFFIVPSFGDDLTRATYTNLMSLNLFDVGSRLFGRGNNYLCPRGTAKSPGTRLYKRRAAFAVFFWLLSFAAQGLVIFASRNKIHNTYENGSRLQLVVENITIPPLKPALEECKLLAPAVGRSENYTGNHRLCTRIQTITTINSTDPLLEGSKDFVSIGVLSAQTVTHIILSSQGRMDFMSVEIRNTGEDGIDYVMESPSWRENHYTLHHLHEQLFAMEANNCGSLGGRVDIAQDDMIGIIALTTCRTIRASRWLRELRALVNAASTAVPNDSPSRAGMVFFDVVPEQGLMTSGGGNFVNSVGRGKWSDEKGFNMNYVLQGIVALILMCIVLLVQSLTHRSTPSLARAVLSSHYEHAPVCDELHDHPERASKRVVISSDSDGTPSVNVVDEKLLNNLESAQSQRRWRRRDVTGDSA